MKSSYNDIISIISEAKVAIDVKNIKQDIKLTEQGIDSLDIFNIILLIQEKYKIEIPDSDIDKLSSIDNIVNHLNNL